MKKQDKERVLIHREDGMIISAKSKAQSALPYLQTMIDEAKEAGLTITAENFLPAAGKPEKWAKNQFSEMIPDQSVGGFKTKKSAVVETLELPDLLGFTSAATNFLNFFRSQQVPVSLLTVESGKAMISQNEVEKMVESASQYVYHPKSKLIWEQFNKLFDQINEFNSLLQKECSTNGIDRLNFAHFATQKVGKLIPNTSKVFELTHRFEYSEHIDI